MSRAGAQTLESVTPPSAIRALASRFRGQTSTTIGTNLAIMVVGLLSGVTAAHLLGPTGNGELNAIRLWPGTIAFIGSGGLFEALCYFTGRHRERSGQVYTTVLVLLAPLAVIVVISGYFAMPWLLHAEPAWVIARAQVFMLYVPVYFAVFAGYSVLRGLGNINSWNVLRFVLAAGYTAIVVASILAPTNRVTFIVYVYLGFVALNALGAVWVFRNKVRGSRAFDRSLVSPLLRYGGLSVTGTTPQLLNLSLDQLAMAAFLPARQLGLYAAAVAWSSGIGPLASAFSYLILPRLAATSEADKAGAQLARTSRLATLVVVVTGALSLIVTPLAIFILFGRAFLPAVPAAFVLVTAALALNMKSFLAEGLRGLGKPGLAAVSEIVGLVVTVPCLIVLLPRWGIMGAAVASLLSYCAGLLTAVWLLKIRARVGPRELFAPRLAEIRQLSGRLRSA
ncbi:MAG TPA: polysaccharide biosynthesis C-terminal domain-containing protein [Chloroflexota bacterium]|nr:polysaccharide biosynthesis C-terminal domain-containing protein [Chloroflexota bacterium]